MVERPLRISGYGISFVYTKEEVEKEVMVLQMQDEEGNWVDVPTITFLNGEEVVNPPKDYEEDAD